MATASSTGGGAVGGAATGAGVGSSAAIVSMERLTELASLSDSALREWLAGVEWFLLDCDGVLWLESKAIDGASAAVETLRAAGKKVLFVTNNSTKSRRMYVAKLAKMGIEAHKEEVVTSAYCAVSYVKSTGYNGKVYVFGEEGLEEELAEAGYSFVGPEDGDVEFDPSRFSRAMLDPEVKMVVAGFDRRMNYNKLSVVCSYLRYGGARLVLTNRDLTFPAEDMQLPGGGVALAAIEMGSGKKAEFTAGKPSQSMLERIVAEHGVDPRRTVMVGDRLNTDILFGNRGGCHTLMVCSGVSTRDDAKAADDDHTPHMLADSLGAFGDRVRAAVST